ncbi:hypothetical protein SAMN05421640_0210 [Ekhidna lutea]|uniref:Lipoprotein n=1 Tax=Ekhidna lutea TaxID=447679 RepID=A0A239EN12_EKHLU|nr:hypothetical protein [Ekhidna lutea]SNS45312.1 hypothetical protein SAMN05421640_0210 [Ekhidna lutea]
MRLGVILKNRKSFYLIFLGLIFLAGCGGDEIQLPPNQLEGKIDNEDWSYKSANGYLISSDLRYRARFLSSKESVQDPCTLPSPSLAHVKAIFKPSLGSFFVAPQALDDNQVQVSFEISTSENLTAQSGFMEIYAIENQVIIGYLQAVLDETNKVEGSFEIRLCN